MVFGSVASYFFNEEAVDFDFGIAPLPYFDEPVVPVARRYDELVSALGDLSTVAGRASAKCSHPFAARSAEYGSRTALKRPRRRNCCPSTVPRRAWGRGSGSAQRLCSSLSEDRRPERFALGLLPARGCSADP